MKLTSALLLCVSAMCPNKVAPGNHLLNVNVGGSSRSFYMMVPVGQSTANPSPGVVSIHGCGSSPEKFEMESLMDQNAAAKGWFNVYPQGTGVGSLGWNAGSGATCRTNGVPNDVDFMRAVVLYMVEHLCVDESRIFAAGFSNGGQMTYNLTCSMHDTFAAFSGTGMRMADQFFPTRCGIAPEDVKPMLQICGSTDFACSASAQTSWLSSYASSLKCSGTPTTTSVTATTTCTKYSNCGPASNEPLEGCMIQGLGHCWSGNNCCDSQCASQNPANLDSSGYLLNWFNSVPQRTTKNHAPLADRLRAQLAHTTFSFSTAINGTKY